MKIWLNEQYAIEKTDGNNLFGKGNDNFDFIEVYIPTAVYEQDNVIPVFIFERADKKKYGEFAHNVGTWEEDGYKVFKHILNGFVLAQKGNLDITIKLNFLKYVDEKRFIEKTKNLYVQGVVLNAIVVENEAFILSDEPEAFLTSLKYLLNDLNARIESGDITAERALADGNGNVITDTYATKAESQQVLADAKAYGDAVFETKGNVLSKVNSLKTEIQNGTVVANNANEAVSYRDDDNNLVVIKDKIENILYLIDEVTGADLTGLQSKINALQTAWNNFMNGSESDDVIDTLNEIRNELSSLDSASKKALYNLGAFDTVSRNTITRRTGRFEINDNTCSFAYYDSYCVVVPLTDIKTSSNMLVKCNRLTSVYDSDVLNNIYKINASDNNFAIIGPNMSMTSDSWKSFLKQAPLYIEYELSTSYEEEIIENQPLITLDQQGSQWLREEWEKGINLGDFNDREGNYWVSNQQDISSAINSLPQGIYTISADITLLELKDGYSTSDGFTLYTIRGGQYASETQSSYVDFESLKETKRLKFTIEKQDYTDYEFYIWGYGNHSVGNIGKISVTNIMLNKGTKPYSHNPYNANKHITNFEAEFLKEESLKSANKYNGNITLPMIDQSRHTLVENLPSGTYTFNLNAINSNANSEFILYANGNNIGTYFVSEGATFTITETSTMTMHCNDNGSISIKPMLNKGSKALPYHEFEGEIVRTKELEEQVEMWQSIANSLQESLNSLSQRVSKLEGQVEYTGEQFVSAIAGSLADSSGYYPAGTSSFTIDGTVKSVSISNSERNDVSFSGSTITYTLRGSIAGKPTSATITYTYTASTSTASEE